jgi:hypothetical protein
MLKPLIWSGVYFYFLGNCKYTSRIVVHEAEMAMPIYFLENCQYLSVQKWYNSLSNCILSIVRYVFSFRLIFFNKIVRFLTVMNLKTIRIVEKKNWQNWLLADRNGCRRGRSRHTRFDEGDDVVEVEKGVGDGLKWSEKRPER